MVILEGGEAPLAVRYCSLFQSAARQIGTSTRSRARSALGDEKCCNITNTERFDLSHDWEAFVGSTLYYQNAFSLPPEKRCLVERKNLVVTGSRYARMDGLMLVGTLRRIEPGLKIIVSTGRTDDSHAAEITALRVLVF